MLPELPLSKSLPNELKNALEARQPLVVMVSLQGCPFCKIARENYLFHMWKAKKISIVQVDMRSVRVLQDVQGNFITHDEQTKRWNISVAPTLLFFGKAHREVAERMQGGYLPDFYQSYLDDRINQATQNLF
jgi:thioredoxin-related protein